MQCTCAIGVCQPHEYIRDVREPLTHEMATMVRRHDANDWPAGKTQYTSAETRLLLEGWYRLDRLTR